MHAVMVMTMMVYGAVWLAELRQASHPCVASTTSDNNFIPNDTVIGCEENPTRFVLVSGPNMGGKSTLLRQTCVAVIMAQLGKFVLTSTWTCYCYQQCRCRTMMIH